MVRTATWQLAPLTISFLRCGGNGHVHVLQSAEEKVPVWYIMDEFGSQVQHSDRPSCAMFPFFHIPSQVAYTILWPLQDLQEGGEDPAPPVTAG